MKLTIQRLASLTAQDRIDLAKVWPEIDIVQLEAQLSDTQGKIIHLNVREVTRRRGVGQYLLEETIAQNSALADWWIADDGDADQGVRAAFMQACGFRAQADGWVR